MACYISKRFLQKLVELPLFPPETDDFIAIEAFTPNGCFGSTWPRFRIGNSYARPLAPATHSGSPESSLLDLDYPYLVAGDFNIHNLVTDPSRLLSSKAERVSPPIVTRAQI